MNNQNPDSMKFSLILATLGRTTELERFLYHLKNQNYSRYELIIVDQNRKDVLRPIIEPYHSSIQIKYFKAAPGLSRARNVGLEHVSGEIVTFPDDDCWYTPIFLEQMAKRFDSQPSTDGFTGQTVDEDYKSIIRFAKKPGYLTKINAWQRVNSSSMFFRKYVISGVGTFDEDLGPGSGTLWGCADDVDYIIRCVDMGYRVYYDPNIIAFLLDHRRYGYSSLHGSAHKYGAGIGRVWKKHKFPYWYVSYHLFRPLAGALASIISANLQKSKYHWLSFLGRWQGWRS